MNKNDIFVTEITDFTADGEGIGKIDAFPLFIKDTVPGDRVRAVITKLKKNYGYARLLEVLQPAADRVALRCPEARRCGGCQLQQLSYEAQLAMKRKKVADNLKRIGGLDAEVLEVLGMQEPWRYRNKAQIPFAPDKGGEVVYGFYAGRTHDIIRMEDCLLSPAEMHSVTDTVKAFMLKYRIPAYEEQNGSGLIRHVLIRKGFTSGELMVCPVINGQKLPHAEQLAEMLQEIPGFTTLCLNINTEKTNVILGRETKTLYGPGYITDSIGGVVFRISPNSFYQVNPVQTELLYGKALEFAGLDGEETVWDLYCGIGTISLFLAKKAKQVYGVEIVPQAIRDAEENARLNGIGNVRFFTGKAEEVLPAWHRENPELRVDVVTLDPPRKGCDEKCLETVLRLSPKRIVYVSCDSATLARDLKYLTAGGYHVDIVQPVDMFPQTVSIETVVKLSK